MSKWHRDGSHVRDESDAIISVTMDSASAAQIIREHNAHDALVAALKSARSELFAAYPDGEGSVITDEIDAALALAEEKP